MPKRHAVDEPETASACAASRAKPRHLFGSSTNRRTAEAPPFPFSARPRSFERPDHRLHVQPLLRRQADMWARSITSP